MPEHHRVLRFIVPALNFPSDTITYQARRARSRVLKVSAIQDDQTFRRRPYRLLNGTVENGNVRWAWRRLGRAAAYGLHNRWSSARNDHPRMDLSTVAIIAGVGAVQLVCLGILGEYIGRMYAHMTGSADVLRRLRLAHDSSARRGAYRHAATLSSRQPKASLRSRGSCSTPSACPLPRRSSLNSVHQPDRLRSR